MPKVKSTRDLASLEILDGKVKVHQRETLKQKDTFYIDELNWTEIAWYRVSVEKILIDTLIFWRPQN